MVPNITFVVNEKCETDWKGLSRDNNCVWAIESELNGTAAAEEQQKGKRNSIGSLICGSEANFRVETESKIISMSLKCIIQQMMNVV